MSTKSGMIILEKDEKITCSSCGCLIDGKASAGSPEEVEVVVDDQQQVTFFCDECVRAGRNDPAEL